MKWGSFVVLTIIMAGLFGGFVVQTEKVQAVACTPNQLTTDPADQMYPAIYGDRHRSKA